MAKFYVTRFHTRVRFTCFDSEVSTILKFDLSVADREREEPRSLRERDIAYPTVHSRSGERSDSPLSASRRINLSTRGDASRRRISPGGLILALASSLSAPRCVTAVRRGRVEARVRQGKLPRNSG